MKPQTKARIERAARSVLKMNRVCIVNLNEPYYLQTTFHHANCKLILASNQIAKALIDVAHHWTLYLAVFCEDQLGRKYTKAIELETNGIYKADHLTEVIKKHHTRLVKDQNPTHVKSSGWIAFPYSIEFSEQQADKLFDAANEVSKEYENVKKPEAYTV